MTKARRAGSTKLPAARLLGVVRRRRAALMVSTALQAVCALVLAVPGATPARAQPAPNARPIGGQVVAGSASIGQSPSVTTITQSSQRAAVNWQSFNVGAQQTVQFAQPSASATTLNRVTSSNPSQIAGRINANGQVILVNQDGVTFYKGAQVNAAGLVVSAAGITNQNFMAGRMVFDQPAAAGARVENQGHITVTQAGLAALVAPQVANSGVITAKLGHVVLAGARAATLDLYGDGLVSIDVTQQVTKVPVGPDGKPVTALVTNTGTVLADGGTVQLTARAVDGIVQNLITADGRISAASVGNKTGEIVLDGIGGSITVAGQLATEGVAAGTRGGRIEAVADGGITLARTAVLNASGKSGGGTVAVGTTLARARGGPSVKAKMTASSVTVDAGAKIFADATANGAGGRVAVLSTGSTQMDGAISAKGGPLGGDGGFVEVSGQTLGLTGSIDVSAPVGATGTILLDPGTLDIVHSGTDDGSLDGSFTGGTLAYNAGGTTAAGTVTDFEIESLGSTGNIVLQATTLLDVQTSLDVAHGLAMQSGGDLIVGPGLSIQGGATLLLGSGIVFPAGTVGAAGSISLGAGDSLIAPTMILQGGSTGIALNNALLSASSSLDISAAGGGVSQLNTGTISTALLTSSAGIVGTASLMAAANSVSAVGPITVTGGNFDLEDASPLTVSGAVVAGDGNILLQQGSGSALTLSSGLTAASTGTISLVADSLTANAEATITATGGPVALVEIAPASTAVAVALGGGAGLLLDAEQLGVIKTGTLRIGAFTETSGAIDVTAPSISFGGTVDLRTGTIAAALDLEANGSIDQPAGSVLSVGTLIGSTNGAATSAFLMRADNDIDALGSISVAGGNFLLNDSGALTVVGAVSAGTPAAPSVSNTASLTLTAGGTLAVGATGMPGSLNAGTVVLTAQNTISEPNGSIGANTLSAQSTLGSVLLSGGLDQIGTIAGLSAAGSIEAIADPTVLTLTGTATGATLFFKNPTVGGTIALDGATLTATGATPLVSLVADHLTQPATSTIAATATGVVQLAPASTTADVTVGGAADTLGAVLSAITPATGTLVIGGFTGTDGLGTITAHSITIAEALNLGTLAGTLMLQSSGAVTQDAGDALLNLGTLAGTAGRYALLDGGNQINAIAGLTASGATGIGVADANALSVTGLVSTPGQLYLQSAVGVTLAAGGTLAGGTLDSVEANAFTITTGTVLAGAEFELAPLPAGTMTLGASGAGLSLVSLTGIGSDALRLGAVTLPGSVTPTTTAGSIVVAGTFGSPAIRLELDSLGGISETAPLIAGTLSGTADLAALLTAGNTIDALGTFTADGFTLDDFTPLTVTGAVAGGPAASITNTGLLTVGGAGSVTANAIALNSGSIEIDGRLSDGGTGTTSLIATGGTINEPGTLISGTLSGTAAAAASLSGTNHITDLGSFVAPGLTVFDAGPLTVIATVSGGTSAAITDTGLLTVSGAGTVTAAAVSLTAGSIAIAGLVSDGGAGTTSLVSTGGTIDETGTLLSGTLRGSAHGDVLLTGSNTVAALGSFAVTGGTDGFVLDDTASLSMIGSVTAPGQVYLQSAVGVTLAAGGTLAGGTLDSVEANAFSITGTGTVLAGAEFELAPLPAGTMTLGASGAGLSLVSLTGIGSDALRLGAVTLPGSVTPTTTAGSIVVAGTFGSPAIRLELDSLGGISETAPLIAGTLSGTADLAALLTAGNTIDALGTFTADGFTLDDFTPLTVTGAVAGGPAASITDTGLLTVGGAGSVTANAIALNSGSIEIDGRLSDGGTGTTSLIATGGTINEPGTLISGVLSGSAAAAASLLGASPTTNQIAGLGPFSASGLRVDDGVGLTVGAAVAGGPSATITDAGLLSVAGAGSVTANAVSLTGTALAIAGLVSDGGAGTTALAATSGTIDESGTLISGVLSGSATGAASLLGATPTTNQIADLGPFSASGLAVDDGIALIVDAAVAGGPSASLSDAGLLTVGGAGSVTANAITLNSSSIEIDGLVMSGGVPNTTSLVATGGTINEPGTLIAGTLSGNASGSASLLGASATTNRIADLGPFSANGLTVDDGIGLTIGAAVAGGPSATLTDAGLLTVGSAGSVTASAISLTGTRLAIAGLVSDGGAGTTSLIATAGTIGETGTLISGVLSGSATGVANLLGATPTTNQIADLGPFSASGLTVDDGIGLIVGAAVSGGPSATLTDAGLLTVVSAGSVTANAVSLSGTSIAIAGLVSDGGAGTTSLIATTGTIDESGTLISGVLSGSAVGAASLLGATPTTNLIAGFGPFSASGLVVDDGIGLTVGAAVAGGPGATITDAGLLSVAGAGSVTASAISLTGTSLAIAGLVSDGGAGTTSLIATAGTIGETGTLISGTLSGGATGVTSLLGATPTTNQIADLGPFSASGLAVDDGIGLTVGAAVSGGASATIADIGLLTVASAGTVTANAVSLTGTSIAIAGLVSDGGAGTTALIATTGTIDESGTLISGVLSGSATGVASLLGATPTTNLIADLGPFSASGLTVDDGISLTVGAAVSGGPSATLADSGLLTVASVGSVTANSVSLLGTSIAIAGLVSDGGAGTTSLIATTGTIDETGTLVSGLLSGSAVSAASLLGATPTTNRIADLGPFSASGLAVDDGIGLTVGAAVSGGLSATITDAGLLSVASAGSVTANAISLTGTSLAIAGLVSDGGAGTTLLIATGGPIGEGGIGGTIDETGTLISGVLSGSAAGVASLLGATPTTNQIADLGPFSASRLTVDDGIALTVGAAVDGGPSATITDAGLLSIASAGSVTANAISLTGTSLAIAGLVSDGGAGTTSLIATTGTINEAGTLVSGVLSGSAVGAASLLGATPTTNLIAGLGPFSASGLVVDDGIGLTVGAAVAGGPSATITDAGLLSVAGAGSVTAAAISLTGTSLAIAGLVSDGGAGTTSLIATAGTIDETGTLISGMLSGSATGVASLLGATPTTNQIADLSPFSASGLTVDDGIGLIVGAAVSGGPSATLTDAGLLTVASAGNVTASAISLTGTSLAIAGLVSDGGAGTTSLIATSGTIDEIGTLISGVLSGSATGAASLLGATPTTNLIADLGPFSASGLTMDDGIALTVGAAVAGGPSAAITDAAVLTVAGAGSVIAQAVSLAATGIGIGGLVSDGGAGTTHLLASSGAITETGTLISGVLSGSAAGAASLLGAGPTANQIADLGPFSANGLTVDDGIGLTVGAAVAGGPSATITDAGQLTVGSAGGVIAQTVNLTASGIGIGGLVSDGGGGTTHLLASAGAITETGTLVSGVLSGSAAGAASLLGVTPTTNQIADLAGFTAAGLTLNDGASLLISAAVAGGPSAIITDSSRLTVASSVTANAVNLIGGTLSIPGLVSDGGVGTTHLVATLGSITETGALISGTLSGGATGAASLIGNNTILALGPFSTGLGLTIEDTGNLAVNGPVSAGPSATITDAGALTVAGSLSGAAVRLSAGAIAVPGAIDAGSSLTLLSGSTIGETGQLLTPLLTGSAPGNASLTGANQIAQINGFSANGLTVNDAANLLLSGTLTSPLIIINDSGAQITLGNNARIVTGGIARPPGRLTQPPPTTDGGAFLTDFRQVGNSFVTGLGGGPSILVITAGPGDNVAFDSGGGLQAPGTWLVLNLAAGVQVSGNVFVKALDVLYSGIGGGAGLFGTINGVSGVPAAGAANIGPATNANYRFNSCAIGSVNCVLLPVEGIPTGNPLDDFSLDAVGNANDEDDLLLPVVSDQDY